MRIAYVHQYFSTPEGSFITRSYELGRRLVEAGHDVTIFCGSYTGTATGLEGPFTGGWREGVIEGMRVVEMDLPLTNNDSFRARKAAFVKFAIHVTRRLFREKFDLMFATSTPLTVGIPALFCKWFRGKPYIFEVRDPWPDLPYAMGAIKSKPVYWGLKVLERLSCRQAVACIGLAEGMVDSILAVGVPRSKVAMIPNGCDTQLFSPSPKPRPDLPGVEPGDLVAVFAGAHGVANGLSTVLDAAAELKRRGEGGIKMLLIGEGMTKADLVKRAQEEELDNVVFMPPMAKKELAQLMGTLDVGLMILANVEMFRFAASPNKFFDYIASGLPVIVNYPGWIGQYVDSAKVGFQTEPDNGAEIADRLVWFRDHSEERKAMGKTARESALTKFDRNQLGEEFVKFVEHWALIAKAPQ